ncbi:BadF/BadG/BcrA/BcrD ATPase family protein [Nocardia sp. 2YAB30]|uniref:BadF/BadG/BcrA/BcrD ATPase family protein n=1 Tax=unclassified Nocardia TaxID=2637762 RepID=UPI003F98B929
MTAFYGIDAGGTRTRISVQAPGRPDIRREIGSINRATVGETAARDRLRETFDIVTDATTGQVSVGWLATAGIVAETAARELSVIRGLLPEGSRLLVASNDAVPMLFAPPLTDRGAVVIAGTGSGFLGGDGETVVQLGGHEYLGADQGSAFDIGMQGLRAALSARDGIGRSSALSEALSQCASRDIAAEARRLAALPFPKQEVARLAPTVIQCWLDGDDVAGTVIATAVEALAAGAARIRELLRLSAADGTVLAGGLVTGSADFAAAVRVAIERASGPHQVTVCADPAATVLSCARRLAEAGDRPSISRAYVDRHVWLMGTPC